MLAAASLSRSRRHTVDSAIVIVKITIVDKVVVTLDILDSIEVTVVDGVAHIGIAVADVIATVKT